MIDENDSIQTGIPYPMDFSSLKKGDYIPADIIQKISGEPIGTTGYQLQLLRMGQLVVERLAEQDPPMLVVVKQEKQGLRILDDQTASSYAFSESERAMRKMKRNYAQLTRCVDTTGFGDAEKRMHENRILITSAMIRGAMDKRKDAILSVKRRPEIPQINTCADIIPADDDLCG